MRRPRWPFLVALVAVLIGVAAWQIVPRIEQGNRDQQAKAADAQAEAAAARLTAQMEPAVSAIGRAKLPGIKACQSSNIAVREGVICANSSAPPAKTTVTLKEAFAELGATGVTAECKSTGHVGPFCRITGDLLGQTFRVEVLPGTSGKTGADPVSSSFIAGGLGSSGVSMPAPSSGAPITLPARPPG